MYPVAKQQITALQFKQLFPTRWLLCKLKFNFLHNHPHLTKQALTIKVNCC